VPTRELVSHLTALNTAPGRRGRYSVGFDLNERARTAITQVPQGAGAAVSDTDGAPRDLDDAGVIELNRAATQTPQGRSAGELAS
jgi:hypothetical protein